MPTPQDLIRVAAADVGYSRWDDPEQGTKFGRWYAELTGSPYFAQNGVPFCAMTVSYWLYHAGVQCEGFPRAVAIDRRDGFARAVEPSHLMAGDPCGFDWNPYDDDPRGDHVGITEDRDSVHASILTYEGNVDGGRVLRCTRKLANVTIGVRPYFDGAMSPAKQAGKLDVDGVAGENTIGECQRTLGTKDDGFLSDQLESSYRWRRNVWAVENGTGEHGSALVRSMQWYLSGKGYDLGPSGIDGLWGYYFSGALQSHLKKLGYYTGDIDHDFAHHSVEALQLSLNDDAWK